MTQAKTNTNRKEITGDDRAYIRSLFPELKEISDRGLADEVVEIWAEVWKESPWDRIEDAPKNPESVGLRHKLIPHTRSVTQQAIASAKAVQQFHGLAVNMDLLVAGGLLHDVSKLLEYSPAEGGAAKSQHGKLIQHGMYGVHKGFEHNLPIELVHMISSHTTQSRHHPSTLEAIILHYVDYLDSDVLVWEAGGQLLLTKR